jgi:hypothetical protein
MSLIDCLSALPASLAGSHVFSFLSLIALGRLDSAIAHNGHRLALHEAFAYVTTVMLPVAFTERIFEYEKKIRQFEKMIWCWCAKRGVALTKVRFSNVGNGEELDLLEKLMLRMPQNGVVRCHCESEIDVEGLASLVLRNDTIRSRITSLNLGTLGDGGVSMPHWGRENMRAAPGEYLPDRGLLGTVGQHCRNLSELVVVNAKPRNRNQLLADEQEWISVAQGCRKLTRVSIWCGTGFTEPATLAFATHCPELKALTLAMCKSTVTDAVLLALAKGCPKLLVLKADEWRIQSVTTVEAAQPLLSRLVCCPLVCSTATSPPVLARVVSYLRSVHTLSISGLSVAHIEALRGLPFTPNKCGSLQLCGAGHDPVEVDHIVTAVASGRPQLRTIELERGLYISGPAMLEVARLCSDVQRVNVNCVDGVFNAFSEATLLTLMQSWPKLEIFRVGDNRSVTDVVLRAMAQHCPRMSTLNLAANWAVTEAALLEAVTLLPCCNFVPSYRFSEDVRGRIYDAMQRGKKRSDNLIYSHEQA